MRLVDGGRRFEMTVSGYQFPFVGYPFPYDPYHDPDWLVVRIEATDDIGSWKRVAASLLSQELPGLAQWLDAAAAGSYEGRIAFLEPDISFEVHTPDDGSDTVTRVLFDLEYRPPWSPSDIAGDPYTIEFTVTSDVLVIAARDVRRDYQAYPQRSNRH